MAAATFDGALPAGVEDRVAEVTALIAAAFSSRASEDEVGSATRRAGRSPARLDAGRAGAPPPEVFAATARELGSILARRRREMSRVEPDGTVTVLPRGPDRRRQRAVDRAR